jgi:hypothetical protein
MKSTLKTATAAASLTRYLLIVTLGVASVIGESDHRFLPESAKAQVEEGDAQERVAKEQGSTDQSSADSNGLSLRLDRAHFIPLSPLSDSLEASLLGFLGYDVDESSPLLDDTISAIMEVYASNQTHTKNLIAVRANYT